MFELLFNLPAELAEHAMTWGNHYTAPYEWCPKFTAGPAEITGTPTINIFTKHTNWCCTIPSSRPLYRLQDPATWACAEVR